MLSRLRRSCSALSEEGMARGVENNGAVAFIPRKGEESPCPGTISVSRLFRKMCGCAQQREKWASRGEGDASERRRGKWWKSPGSAILSAFKSTKRSSALKRERGRSPPQSERRAGRSTALIRRTSPSARALLKSAEHSPKEAAGRERIPARRFARSGGAYTRSRLRILKKQSMAMMSTMSTPSVICCK